MHVAFALLTLLPGRVGGAETNVRGLLGAFGEGAGPDRVTVLANPEVARAYAPFARGPVSIHEMAAYRPAEGTVARLASMGSAALAPGRLRRQAPPGIDVLHYPVTVPLPRLRGVPTVVTLLDVQHRDRPEFFGAAERAYRRVAYDRAAAGADLVLTITEHSRGRMIDTLGLAPDVVRAVPLAVDHERFCPTAGTGDDEALERLALPERFLVYPANLWPHKNHERLVAALARAKDTEIELVLTGRDYGRLDRLRARAATAGVGDRVHHAGYLEPGDLPVVLRAAAGMVFPSLYEGFGLPPLEAMACGCPVACSDGGALREVAAGAALTFDPESEEQIAGAIDSLADPERAAQLREAGLARAAGYTWEASAAAHAEAYRAVADRSAAARS